MKRLVEMTDMIGSGAQRAIEKFVRRGGVELACQMTRLSDDSLSDESELES